ncbi:hypothetical protein CBR_g52256 [Chara braunii]|uniref:PPM-type phosphatase domain-containing protein n=1 Tax=Chara braunii TaxID=69332 RepID=A0A388MA81_CHABU|nr:hypothetical protein CBR_g52256 [Chara braunii]|eukprot:GBG91369.1 hypothetical protein CBR_g52256 [Chara braunii]
MQSFLETDEDFMDVVRCSFEMSPHLATVGSCAVIGVVSKAKLFVGNLGDSRAVLGTVDGSADSGNCLAVPLSQVHNVNNEDVRRELISKFPDDRQIVTERRGVYRVKGKVQVTRAFGDCYLKAREFNQEPLFPRFRVPEPFYPPVITAEPEVTMRLLSPQDQFIIFASDGLWEYVTPQEAVDVVYHTNRGDVARMLIKFTLQRAAKKHDMTYGDLLKLSRGQRREFHDDITVIIFFFTKDVNDTLWGESTYHSVRGNGNDSIRGDTVFEPDRQIQDEEEMDLFGVDDG